MVRYVSKWELNVWTNELCLNKRKFINNIDRTSFKFIDICWGTSIEIIKLPTYSK